MPADLHIACIGILHPGWDRPPWAPWQGDLAIGEYSLITWIKQQHCTCSQGRCTSSQLGLHALLHGQTLCEQHEFRSTIPCMGCEVSAKTGRATCQVLPSGIAIRILLECAGESLCRRGEPRTTYCQVSANSMGAPWGYDMSHLNPLPKHDELKQT